MLQGTARIPMMCRKKTTCANYLRYTEKLHRDRALKEREMERAAWLRYLRGLA